MDLTDSLRTPATFEDGELWYVRPSGRRERPPRRRQWAPEKIAAHFAAHARSEHGRDAYFRSDTHRREGLPRADVATSVPRLGFIPGALIVRRDVERRSRRYPDM